MVKLYSFVMQKFSGTLLKQNVKKIFRMSQSGFHKVFILPFKWWFHHAKVVASVGVLKVVCSQFAFIINFLFIGLGVMHSNATL
jgi:hypothetical protein